MKVNALLTDDDAVSPVIGVILMVAITVILAAVIGTFVLGLENRVGEAAPTASFSWEFNDQGDGWGSSGTGTDFANITHDGGQALDAEDITVRVGSTDVTPSSGPWSGTNDITAGDRVAIGDDGGTAETHSNLASGTHFGQGDEIRVVWNNPSGDKTATIGKNEIP